MAYSAGFSPHPKISYANSAATGVASEAEYVELGVTLECDPQAVRAALDDALPPGLDVLEVVVSQTPDFAHRLQASLWQLELPQVPLSDLQAAVDALLATEEVLVERMTKNGKRTFDARSAVVSATCSPSPDGDCAILMLVVRHGTPSVRPDDVLSALRGAADLVPPIPVRITRLAQGPLDEEGGVVGDPLEPDRVPAAQT